jgi:hypothetical protein
MSDFASADIGLVGRCYSYDGVASMRRLLPRLLASRRAGPVSRCRRSGGRGILRGADISSALAAAML